MGWTRTQWACGHDGEMQLYGKGRDREARVASEAGRDCMACWLVGQWESSGDPRAKRPDRYQLAGDIAKSKGKSIYGLPETAPTEPKNPLAEYSTEQLQAELERRKTEGVANGK